MTCTGDTGYFGGEKSRAGAALKMAIAKEIALTAIAVSNDAAVKRNFKKRFDVANRTLKLSEEIQNFNETVYWPREMDFLSEFKDPEPVEDVAIMARRYGGRLASMVAGGFAPRIRKAKCKLTRYCTSTNTNQVQSLMLARGQAMSNARLLGRSIAFAEYEARNDTNMERRLQAAALGRGLMQNAAALYDNAGRGLAAVGAELSQAFNSAIGAFGNATRGLSTAIGNNNAAQTRLDKAKTSDNGIGTRDQPDYTGMGIQWDYNTFYKEDAPDMGSGSINVDSGPNRMLASSNGPSTALGFDRGNESRVSHNNLMHTGYAQFDVISETGGVVIVDMASFSTEWVDGQVPQMGVTV